MKDRTLVFYKKRDVGVSSTFKVITVCPPFTPIVMLMRLLTGA
jgi:hypothetical protein